MQKSNNITDLRLQLLANGYTPIPNKDKACYMEGWPKVQVDEDVVRRWGRMHGTKGTGLRVQDGLCVIDIDIDHPIIDDIIEVMLDTLPEDLQPDRLERAGKGHKIAWYVQTDEMFSRLHTRRWVAEGDTEDDVTHSIEIFGGGSTRQFGSFGPHTLDDDGKVKVAYRWAEESPADVPLNALPFLTKHQMFAMLDAAEVELRVQGFTPVARTKTGEGTPSRVYDLTEDMTFELDEGGVVTLSELTERVKGGWAGRCSASWLEGPSAKNTKRCLVSQTATKHVAIWESAGGDTHMAASIAPTDFTERVDRIAEKLRERKDKRRSRLSSEDDHVNAASKLLVSYAYLPTEDKVMPIWATSDDEAMKVSAFRTMMQPWTGVEVGPRGGEKRISAVDIWLSNMQRVTAAGLRMRPDQPRPTFEEHGKTWINTYRAPDHGPVEDGTIDGGLELLAQLVPDDREREWVTRWLAYKYRYPHVPGPSLIMVARGFGTGRGTFGAFLKTLFGNQYVTNVPFHIFAGLSSQSQYTDWGLDALFAIVNESSATGDQSSYQTKSNVYEHLKEVVEPRATERTYIRKGVGSLRALASTTAIVMTNNPDAVPLPEDDRRFAVITNGERRDPAFWEFVNGWMQRKCNVAAFAQHLTELDLGDYDPYDMPIQTIAKEEMSDLNKSALDTLIEETVDSMVGVFVPEQVVQRAARIASDRRLDLPNNWKALAVKMVQKTCYPARYEGGRKIRVAVKNRSYEAYCKTSDVAKRYRTSDKIRCDWGANGNVFGPQSMASKLKEK